MPKLHNDFKQFYTQYDQRRGKSFKDTFKDSYSLDVTLSTWYDSIQI
jgi:hypothetical protein